MTAIPSEQETPFLNSLLKPFIGLFNGLLPLAWIIAFLFASIFSMTLLRDPFGTLPIEMVLVPFVILSGTHVSRHAAFQAKREAAERIRIQQAAESEIAPDVLETANAVIPSFWTLLKRNLIIALFFVPLVAVTSIVVLELSTGIIDFIRNTAESRAGAKLLAVLVVLPFIGWLTIIGFGLKSIGTFVDGRILRMKFDLPVDEETRHKRQMQERAKAANTETVTPFQRIKNMVSGLFMMLLLPLMLMVPLVVVTGILQLTSLPENIKVTILAVVMLAFCFGLMIFVPMQLNKRFPDRLAQKLDELEQEPEVAADPEALKELRELRTEIEDITRLENSTESLLMNASYKWFLGLMGGAFILSFIIAMVARAAGADGETAKGIMTLALLVGVIGIFVLIGHILPHVTPQSPAMKAMEQYESCMRRGDYDTIIPLMEQLMHDLPNWESKIPAAGAYAQVGRLEEAERIVRDALAQLSNPHGDAQRELYKLMLGQAFGLLGEIYLMGLRFDDAEQPLKRALEFDGEAYPSNNSTAKFYLYRGEPEIALTHLDRAAQAYLKDKIPVSAYNKALRAWAMALLGRHTEANALMVEAMNQVPAEHLADMAEIYFYGGYVARAQRKSNGSRRSFEMAIKLDPKGIYAQIAQKELA